MEKNMEHEMETGIIWWFICMLEVSQNWGVPFWGSLY